MKHCLIPLSMVAKGERVRLAKVRAGACMCSRLSALGLTPGVEMTIVQDAGGPLLLEVRNSRLAIGRGMAHRILVEPILNQES